MTKKATVTEVITDQSNQQSPRVLLSPEKLSKLGNELTDIMNILEMDKIALEALEGTQKTDTAIFSWIARKYVDVAYVQNENLLKRLDIIASLLLNNSDARELAAIEKEMAGVAE